MDFQRPCDTRRVRRPSASARSSGRRPVAPVALVVLLAAALPLELAGQAAPLDSAGLGSGPHAHMSMLLEKSIFRVDVLTLDIHLGRRAVRRVDSLLAPARQSGARLQRRELANQLAATVLEADQVLARIEFRRGVGLDRFLDGIRSSLEKAAEADLITPSEFDTISSMLPEWYGFLAERGIRSGDQMYQRIRGDTLRTVYVTNGGETLLDQTDIGPERRLSVLGGYFAPGSDFRNGLLGSLLGDD